MNRSISAGLLCVFGCLAISACSNAPKDAKPAASPSPARVSVATARFGSIDPSEHLSGIVAPSQNVAISSNLTERAIEVRVQEGDHVKAGQVLAVLDTADLRAALDSALATARSAAATTQHNVYQGGLTIDQSVNSYQSSRNAIAQAQATLKRDQSDLERYRQLLGSGYISAQQVQQQQTLVNNDEKAVDSALATADSAKSAVTANGTLNTGGLQSTTIEQSKAQEQVALAQAEQQRVLIAKATIVSPIDGVVVNRNINTGEYPGSRQILTLQQIDPVYAILRGSGSQITGVVEHSTAKLHAADLRDASYTGNVVGVLNQINPGSTDFQVKVQVPNANGKLRPGMPIEADLRLHPLQGLIIPTSAFVDESQSSIMIVDDAQTARLAHVRAGGSAGTASIVSGVKAGTRVVSNGQAGIAVGQKVRVK